MGRVLIGTSWSAIDFFQALLINLFSVITVVAGYGNFAAETRAGRIFCLLFGIIGIPFMLSGTGLIQLVYRNFNKTGRFLKYLSMI